MMVWIMSYLFQGCILRFHVNLQGVYEKLSDGEGDLCLSLSNPETFLKVHEDGCSIHHLQDFSTDWPFSLGQ